MQDDNTDSPVSYIRLQKRTVYILLMTGVIAIGVIVTLIVMRQRTPQQAGIDSLVVGKQAPDFTLQSLDGVQVSLSQFRGQPVVINFWASWCLPCREEMPELVRAYEAHKGEGLIILGLNLTYSDSLPDIEAFASEFKISFPILLDEDGTVAGRLYQIPGVPTTIFINRDGTIQRIQVGQMSGEQIEQFVAEILKRKN